MKKFILWSNLSKLWLRDRGVSLPEGVLLKFSLPANLHFSYKLESQVRSLQDKDPCE